MQNKGTKSNSDQGLTLMVLGRKAGPPMRFTLSKTTLTALALILMLAFAGLTFLVFDYVDAQFSLKTLEGEKKGLLRQNARLSERGREKDQQIAALSDKMRAIELTLERVEEMEGHVRVLSGLPEYSGKIISDEPTTHLVSDNVDQSDLARLFHSAGNILNRMNVSATNLKKVSRYFSEQRSEILQIPSQWPLRGWVTSVFGMRASPFTGQQQMHNGIDIAAPEGAIIRAPASGRVIFDGTRSGYGNVIVLKHGRGITTLYGHLAKALVSEGQKVLINMPIALCGNSGRSTGPHLHYEVRLNGVPVNPKRFLPTKKAQDDSKAEPPSAPTAWDTTMVPSEPVPAQPVNSELPTLEQPESAPAAEPEIPSDND